MGNSTWSRTAYATRSVSYQSQSRDEVFQKRSMLRDLDPRHITLRESVDSEANPESTAIIIGLDVTGSMGMIAEHIAKNGLGTLVETIIDNKPVTDPHLMLMGIGDIQSDQAPLQVTQFEADIKIADQLTNIWLEGNGGGNSYESYDLPWIFAANKTKTDCFDKRGKKGYLFTIGDELPPRTASKSAIQEVLGVDLQGPVDETRVLADAQEKFQVFHVIVEQGSYCRVNLNNVVERWTDLLDKRAIRLNNYECISEVITAVIEVNEGRDPYEVIEAQQTPAAKKAVEYSLFGSGQ